MTRMTRMGTGFVMVENLFRSHPPGEHPLHRSPFYIRVIREIRGSNCCFRLNRRDAKSAEKGRPELPEELSLLPSFTGPRNLERFQPITE
ncbi:MAG: hypothetical protein NT154_09535 [Verrucomicrobia bacterium]|nr:hypothetical protein [Verrucomicrobiota bacterium]